MAHVDSGNVSYSKQASGWLRITTVPKSRSRQLARFVSAVRSCLCFVKYTSLCLLYLKKNYLTKLFNLFLHTSARCCVLLSMQLSGESVPERWHVGSLSGFEAELGFVFVSVLAQAFCCLFLSERSCLFSCKARTAVAVHYREKGGLWVFGVQRGLFTAQAPP